jgi:ankyrin repeat protein
MINAPDGKGQTLLTRACAYGNKEVTWLLDHDALIDWIDNDGRTPLFYAAKRARLPFIKLLVEQGACINLTFDVNHQSPLGTCRIKSGAVDDKDKIAKYLLGKGLYQIAKAIHRSSG